MALYELTLRVGAMAEAVKLYRDLAFRRFRRAGTNRGGRRQRQQRTASEWRRCAGRSGDNASSGSPNQIKPAYAAAAHWWGARRHPRSSVCARR
jgi:hypothetical protein